MRGVDLPSKVLLCLLSSCHLNRSTFTNQLPGIRDGSMMLSRRNLVYLTLQTFPPHAAALPPGSLFICGHRNVNSLSLSISEKTTVTPTCGSRRSKGTDRFHVPRRRLDRCSGGQVGLSPAERGWVSPLAVLLWDVWRLVSQRQTTSNCSPGTRRNASERSTFIHAAPDVDSVFYF